MKAVFGIAWRQLCEYFVSPLAYGMLALFWAGCFFLTWGGKEEHRKWIPGLLAIAVVWVSGRPNVGWGRKETDSRETEVVLGRFGAGMAFVGMLLLPVGAYMALMGTLSGKIAAGFLGLGLEGGWVATLTLFCGAALRRRNKAMGLAMGIVLAMAMLPVMALSGRQADFARGVIDLSHLTFFIAWTGAFLIAVAMVRTERSKAQSEIRNGVAGGIMAVLMAGGALGATWVMERHPKRWDLTETHTATLRPETEAILKGLKGRVRLLMISPVMTGDGAEEKQWQVQVTADLLEEYGRRSSNITVEVITAAQGKKWQDLPMEAGTIWVQGEGRVPLALGFEGLWEKRGAGRWNFWGEQRISGALASLQRKAWPRVILVRAGGRPLGGSGVGGGPFSKVAEMLRAAGVEVLEKDLSGASAMAAQARGEQLAEADEAALRDRSAVWIAFAGMLAEEKGQRWGNPIPGKLKEHLDEGGSAMVLLEPGDGGVMEPVLHEWGMGGRTDAVIVRREAAHQAELASASVPYVLTVRIQRKHPVTRLLEGEEVGVVYASPISYWGMGETVGAPLLPVAREGATWGEMEIGPLVQSGAPAPTFDAGKDIENTAVNPMYAGAAVEKGRGRLVVIGGASMFSDRAVGLMDAKGIAYFPGNAGLFLNSVWWLMRDEPLLTIPPLRLEKNGDWKKGL